MQFKKFCLALLLQSFLINSVSELISVLYCISVLLDFRFKMATFSRVLCNFTSSFPPVANSLPADVAVCLMNRSVPCWLGI